jgi:hypothetical protein
MCVDSNAWTDFGQQPNNGDLLLRNGACPTPDTVMCMDTIGLDPDNAVTIASIDSPALEAIEPPDLQSRVHRVHGRAPAVLDPPETMISVTFEKTMPNASVSTFLEGTCIIPMATHLSLTVLLRIMKALIIISSSQQITAVWVPYAAQA